MHWIHCLSRHAWLRRTAYGVGIAAIGGCDLEPQQAHAPGDQIAMVEAGLGATSYTYAGDAKLCRDITPGNAANGWTFGCVSPANRFAPNSVVRPWLRLTNINVDHRYRIEVYRSGALLWTWTTNLITVGNGWLQGFFVPEVGLDGTLAAYEVRLYVATSYYGPYTLLATLPFTVAAPSNTGWTSETGYNAPSATQRAIVAAARAKVGQRSGQSKSNPTKWGVDTDGGDGEPMRQAIKAYRDWLRTPGATTLEGVRTTMRAKLAASHYSATEKGKIVKQIEDVTSKGANGALVPASDPTTADDILAYLKIQKQCLEFAASTALDAGATPSSVVPYNALGGANRVPQAQARPGMGLYKMTGTTHAMIIVDIEWRNGVPVRFKVVDANYESGWTNPPGEVMWLRNVRERDIAADPSYAVANYR